MDLEVLVIVPRMAHLEEPGDLLAVAMINREDRLRGIRLIRVLQLFQLVELGIMLRVKTTKLRMKESRYSRVMQLLY